MVQPDVPGDDQPRIFEQSVFEEIALQVLTELQRLVIENSASHELAELQRMSIWGHKLPSYKNDALSVLFGEFEGIDEQFDFRKTSTELCTLPNLTELTKACGPQRVRSIFQDFFESRAFQVWNVLIPLEEVRVRGGTAEVRGDSVQLRSLTAEERAQLAAVHASHRADDLFFAVSPRAGDVPIAVARARRQIDVFLAPYYLHRMRSPDAWWRARTSRQIVSPLALYSNPQGLFGAARELRQLKTEASDLFTPNPPIEPEWKRAVEQLGASWTTEQPASDPLGELLQLCSRWMFYAESDELHENAFLKHAIAWEALLATEDRPLRCWYLLLLCLGSADRLCVKTVSHADRLVDRRNSFAHPKIKRDLYGTVESDLTRLKQSVWWSFDEALRVWQSPGGQAIDWARLLADCYESIRSDDLPQNYDALVFSMLEDLQYVERDDRGQVVLSREGQSLRVEAHITRARQLWYPKPRHTGNPREDPEQNPKDSAASLARALQVAIDQALPRREYHALLTIEERESSMDRAAFEDGWQRAGVAAAPPTAPEISQRLQELEHDFGVTRECVGWKKQ